MTVQKQIKEYITAQPEPKRSEMQELHGMILALMPACKLWFLDGKDEKGKIVSNPNIGYGSQTIEYANGKTREFYQIGVSANTTGISVYIMGLSNVWVGNNFSLLSHLRTITCKLASTSKSCHAALAFRCIWAPVERQCTR